MLSCSPSPFRDEVRIQSRLPDTGPLHLAVYDLSGRRVRSLRLEEGATSVVWDGHDRTGRPAPPGVYFLRAMRGGDVETGRVEKVR